MELTATVDAGELIFLAVALFALGYCSATFGRYLGDYRWVCAHYPLRSAPVAIARDKVRQQAFRFVLKMLILLSGAGGFFLPSRTTPLEPWQVNIAVFAQALTYWLRSAALLWLLLDAILTAHVDGHYSRRTVPPRRYPGGARRHE